jgi:hypothetical protein
MNTDQYSINRREALKCAALMLGGSVIGAEAFLTGCVAKNNESTFLSDSDLLLLDEIGETILPESSRSPGAKAAQIGAFMKMMVMECYNEAEQKIFQSGLADVRQSALDKYHKDFLHISSEERFELLAGLDKVARSQGNNGQHHYFAMMKQLTILGYFSSEVGVTQAKRYDPIPGGYDGCVEYKDGDKAWYGPLSSIG